MLIDEGDKVLATVRRLYEAEYPRFFVGVVEAATETGLGVLAITHYSRLLHELRADHVHVLAKGMIVRSGGPELAETLEQDGYVGLVGPELANEDESVKGRPGETETFADLFGGDL